MTLWASNIKTKDAKNIAAVESLLDDRLAAINRIVSEKMREKWNAET